MTDGFQEQHLDNNRPVQAQGTYRDTDSQETSILSYFEEAAVSAIIAAAEGNSELVNIIASEAIRRHNWRTAVTVAAGGTSRPMQRLKVEDVEEVILDAKRLIEIIPYIVPDN